MISINNRQQTQMFILALCTVLANAGGEPVCFFSNEENHKASWDAVLKGDSTDYCDPNETVWTRSEEPEKQEEPEKPEEPEEPEKPEKPEEPVRLTSLQSEIRSAISSLKKPKKRRRHRVIDANERKPNKTIGDPNKMTCYTTSKSDDGKEIIYVSCTKIVFTGKVDFTDRKLERREIMLETSLESYWIDEGEFFETANYLRGLKDEKQKHTREEEEDKWYDSDENDDDKYVHFLFDIALYGSEKVIRAGKRIQVRDVTKNASNKDFTGFYCFVKNIESYVDGGVDWEGNDAVISDLNPWYNGTLRDYIEERLKENNRRRLSSVARICREECRAAAF